MSFRSKYLQRLADKRYYARNREKCLERGRLWRLAHPKALRPRITLSERFFRHVHINTITGCWEWIGKRNRLGYGYFKHENRSQRAHLVAWRMFRGEWPADKESDHLCVNASCVNPFHIEPVTKRENIERACERKGWKLRKK